MYFSTAKQMERLDFLAVKDGLKIQQMMELAGWHMVEVFKRLRIRKNSFIIIVVGKGNKGGDGLSAARHLINHGWKNILVVFVSNKLSRDSSHHRDLLKLMNVKMTQFVTSRNIVLREIARADYIIDSLIGYHLEGAPRGIFKELIETMNVAPGKIIAYDLPSGLDATTGECLEPCIRAWVTLTLALPKNALKIKSGKQASGIIFLGDIGIPIFLYNEIQKGSRPNFNNSGIIKI